MPGSKRKQPKIVAHLEGLIRETKGVPDRALAVWLLPLFTHHRDALVGAELPPRVAELAALAGVDLTAAVPEEG